MQDSMFSEIFGEDDLPEFKQLVDPSIHESDLDIVPYASIQALAHSCLKTQTQEGLYGTGLSYNIEFSMQLLLCELMVF